MSRSGYSDYYAEDNWALITYRGQVASAIRGKRGQAFLKDLLESLDSMPVKELISDDLIKAKPDGTESVCTIGRLGQVRNIDMTNVDPENAAHVGKLFNIATPLAREIVYENDENWNNETPAQRWTRMRKWVASKIIKEKKNG